MPQPAHVTALRDADEASLPDELKPYFQKCRDKLGFVPNVLRAWLLRPERLRNFVRAYDELMLGPSGLSKLEREMVAVAVSSHNRCYYCLVAHGAAVRKLSGDPQLGEMMAFNYRVAPLAERQRAMLDPSSSRKPRTWWRKPTVAACATWACRTRTYSTWQRSPLSSTTPTASRTPLI